MHKIHKKKVERKIQKYKNAMETNFIEYNGIISNVESSDKILLLLFENEMEETQNTHYDHLYFFVEFQCCNPIKLNCASMTKAGYNSTFYRNLIQNVKAGRRDPSCLSGASEPSTNQKRDLDHVTLSNQSETRYQGQGGKVITCWSVLPG